MFVRAGARLTIGTAGGGGTAVFKDNKGVRDGQG